MSKSKFTTEVEKLNTIPEFSGSNWNSIRPEYAARMRLQNQFKSGIDIAKYTASLTVSYTHLTLPTILRV